MAYHAPAARFDCGSPLCHRKGCAGFTRRDKMLEHERERHGLRSERSETEGVEIQSSSTGGGGLLYHLNDGYVPRADDQSEETSNLALTEALDSIAEPTSNDTFRLTMSRTLREEREASTPGADRSREVADQAGSGSREVGRE
ncbi:hypothetical protein LTR09_009635 [Extremus antarcticus]|uniref:C2H2-type domain-containing protein n=1 Tax=Extremus antarcticus TaxID=702011 RepID=A0AAJ0GBN7_9PEZI|nr:hypothetical protein LTR09_009635 [Extremus antarcticus]